MTLLHNPVYHNFWYLRINLSRNTKSVWLYPVYCINYCEYFSIYTPVMIPTTMTPAPNVLSNNQRFVERYSLCVDKGMRAIHQHNMRYRTQARYREYSDFTALALYLSPPIFHTVCNLTSRFNLSDANAR